MKAVKDFHSSGIKQVVHSDHAFMYMLSLTVLVLAFYTFYGFLSYKNIKTNSKVLGASNTQHQLSPVTTIR